MSEQYTITAPAGLPDGEYYPGITVRNGIAETTKAKALQAIVMYDFTNPELEAELKALDELGDADNYRISRKTAREIAAEVEPLSRYGAKFNGE
jgi:hypothetical protein